MKAAVCNVQLRVDTTARGHPSQNVSCPAYEQNRQPTFAPVLRGLIPSAPTVRCQDVAVQESCFERSVTPRLLEACDSTGWGPGIPKPYINEYIGANVSGSSSATKNASSILEGLETSDATWTAGVLINNVFTLAYAQEAPNAVGEGGFTPTWDQSITPSLIAAYKRARPGTKFLASFGGPTLSNGSNYVFQPQPGDCSLWVERAAGSASEIVNMYNLDVEVMVSIAPSGSTQAQYGAVYSAAGNYINLVNYQAYKSAPSTQTEYDTLYGSISPYPYPYDKLLLGIQTSALNTNFNGSTIVSVFLDLYSKQQIRAAESAQTSQ
ncbi:hypothetical protein WJX73_005065 [Symbiochloris irregularis]|uniref:Uncharacterized protein n=1 Tax=Symbiochloris irregularis TaxID=706552 RepID=A0AAW1NS46_9CHLO